MLVASAYGGDQTLATFVAADEASPAVAVLPAIGIKASYYSTVGRALASLGLHAVLVDHPGQGISPIRASRSVDWGYEQIVNEHLVGVRHAVAERFPKSVFYWLGHSLGGHLSLLHAGLHPNHVAGVALVAAGTPYYKNWSGFDAFRISSAAMMFNTVASTLGYLPGKKIGFGGREARTLIAQWSRVARTGSFTSRRFDGEAALNGCEAPIFTATLRGDILAPPDASDHLINKTSSRDITRWLWEPTERLTHNNWPKHPEAAIKKVAAWIAR